MKKPLPLALIAALFCGITFAQDAAMFRGNPQHSGIYSSAAVPAFTKVKWKFRTRGRVLSSPAVVGDTAYVGSTDHNLYAVNLADGTQRWKFRTGSRVVSSPAVVGGLVYFGSYDGNFYAVDASTGKEKWKFETAGERRYAAKHIHGAQPPAETMPDPFDFYMSSPTVADGTVYFGSGDGNVYALDAASGRLKWKFSSGDVVHASPAVADGTVFVGSWDTFFYAIDAGTGKQKWKFKTGDDPEIHNQVGIQASALVADGLVYFGCRDSKLYALDAKTGERKWVFDNKGSWVINSPAIHDGKLYFSTSDSGRFYGVDPKTGAELMSLKLIWPMFSSPAIAGDHLYIGSHEGKLIDINLKTQKLAWTFQTDGSKENGATYTNPDGTTKFEAAMKGDFYDEIVAGVDRLLSVGAVLSSPVVVDGVIYFGSADGNLYAIM
jgi:outer membrane protein assembly factor BamB